MARAPIACVAAAILFCSLSSAQTGLPPPPVSPAPVTVYEYDANGNPTRTVQAPGTTGFAYATRSHYDALNRRYKITDAKNFETQFGHDGLDRITQITDPRQLATQTPRNGLGDVKQLISPDTGTARHTYDAAGNLKTRTDSRNIQTIYGYDALNRLVSAAYNFTKGGLPISVEDVRPPTNFWRYDEQGPGFSNGVGRLTSSRFPSGATQYAYDPQGRLLTDTQRVDPVAGGNAAPITSTVTYGYDAAGHVTRITYPSGRVLTVTHTDGWPSALSLARDAASASQPLIAQIGHTAFGVVKGWQWNTTTGWQAHDKVFDLWGRIVRYRLGSVVRDIAYDEADRIRSYVHYDANSGAALATLNQLFGYDELGRLTDIATATELWTIGYDASGNRASVTRNGVQGIYTTPPTSNRLQSISQPPRSFGHDFAGNTTSDSGNGTMTAVYDRMGHLASITRAGSTSSYSYNAAGQRVRKVTPEGTLIFVYDQGGQLLGEYDASGTALREYVWLGATPIAMVTPGANGNPTIFYIHADHLDAPRVVQDAAGTPRWTWFAEPFGTTAPNTNPSQQGTFTQNLRFPGQYADAESGLSYNHARQYDASIGRYAESDPIGLQGGINTYVYVEGNPVSNTDPEGLQPAIPMPPLIPGIPSPGRPSPRPVDPSEPNGPQYTRRLVGLHCQIG